MVNFIIGDSCRKKKIASQFFSNVIFPIKLFVIIADIRVFFWGENLSSEPIQINVRIKFLERIIRVSLAIKFLDRIIRVNLAIKFLERVRLSVYASVSRSLIQ